MQNTQQHTTQTVNSIHLAKEIETLFHLNLSAFHSLPMPAQIAILAKARHAHDYKPIYQRKGN